jgi:hypothetical protein
LSIKSIKKQESAKPCADILFFVFLYYLFLIASIGRFEAIFITGIKEATKATATATAKISKSCLRPKLRTVIRIP